MLFGFTNAPDTFQRTLDIMLNEVNWRTCPVYLYNVIVFSMPFNDHLTDV